MSAASQVHTPTLNVCGCLQGPSTCLHPKCSLLHSVATSLAPAPAQPQPVCQAPQAVAYRYGSHLSNCARTRSRLSLHSSQQRACCSTCPPWPTAALHRKHTHTPALLTPPSPVRWSSAPAAQLARAHCGLHAEPPAAQPHSQALSHQLCQRAGVCEPHLHGVGAGAGAAPRPHHPPGTAQPECGAVPVHQGKGILPATIHRCECKPADRWISGLLCQPCSASRFSKYWSGRAAAR